MVVILYYQKSTNTSLKSNHYVYLLSELLLRRRHAKRAELHVPTGTKGTDKRRSSSPDRTIQTYIQQSC